ncbi:D-alanyl-D-alanine carboxypeptidase [Nonomuraea sp. 3-1Str]|uniref:D-alanyl-D-alanine carboxypeptidase family protein n=1 Tax=Nonomuraea sp. 3-1Str TaxID=2929801 RepID=UPI00285FAD53|nr:D-alanyl-D-alanine carboxypeptidase [Nonomuraea sp. 3-1Str]MDR8408627.1 D-alanyl-D-alanine carboxypeptidase [Nonomuraea sp. 3-1Str]
MWTKLVPATALLAAVTLTGTAHATPAEPPTSPVGGDRLGHHGLVAPDGVKEPPKTKATAYVIADADTGEVLAAKNPHVRYLPASTLKILTAVTLIPLLDKDRTVRPSDNAVNQEGSAVGLTTKPIYKVDDLFKALLMSSGNDAAMALAEANGGLAKTLRDMNAEAHQLQANDTVAKTPSGLDQPGQSSSAYDLTLIARAGLANPAFRRYVSTKVAKFPAPKNYYEISNHNKLLWRYPGMIGVKNGWTSKALGSFVGAATRNGHTIIVAIMRHDGYFWEEVAGLLDWGFAERGKVTPVGRLVDPLPAAVPVREQQAAPAPAASASARPSSLLGTAAAAQTDSSRRTGLLVVGGALLFGLAWLGFGLYRRRSRL